MSASAKPAVVAGAVDPVTRARRAIGVSTGDPVGDAETQGDVNRALYEAIEHLDEKLGEALHDLREATAEKERGDGDDNRDAEIERLKSALDKTEQLVEQLVNLTIKVRCPHCTQHVDITISNRIGHHLFVGATGVCPASSKLLVEAVQS